MHIDACSAPASNSPPARRASRQSIGHWRGKVGRVWAGGGLEEEEGGGAAEARQVHSFSMRRSHAHPSLYTIMKKKKHLCAVAGTYTEF